MKNILNFNEKTSKANFEDIKLKKKIKTNSVDKLTVS